MCVIASLFGCLSHGEIMPKYGSMHGRFKVGVVVHAIHTLHVLPRICSLRCFSRGLMSVNRLP